MGDSKTIEAHLKWLQNIRDIKTLRHQYAHGANIIDAGPKDHKASAARRVRTALATPDFALAHAAHIVSGA